MMSGMEGDVSELRKVVQDAWNEQYTIDHLNRTLARFEPAVCNPLQHRAPDASIRQAVQSGKVSIPGEPLDVTLSTEVTAWVLEFSDAVDLNELDVVQLVLRAFRMRNDNPLYCASQQQTATNYFFSQRRDLLIAILDIIQMVDIGCDIDPRLVRIAQSYAQRLRDKGIIENIIIKLNDLSRIKTSSFRPFIDYEIRQLALILFYFQQNIGIMQSADISSSSSSSSSSLQRISKLAESLSQQIPISLPSESPEKVDILTHYESLNTTVFILLAILMKTMMNPHNNDAVSPSIIFVDWISTDISSSHSASIFGLMQFINKSHSISNVPDSSFLSLCSQAFSSLYAFVSSPSPLIDHKPLVNIITLITDMILSILRDYGSIIIRSPHNPGQLLSTLGELIETMCVTDPSITHTLWQSESFHKFISALDQLTPLTSSRFSAYIALLCSLCVEDSNQKTFTFIAGAKLTNWHRVFDIFARAIRDTDHHHHHHQQQMQKHTHNEHQSNGVLPNLDIRILSDLLRLVASMSRSGPSANSMALHHFNVVDTLFHLLSCAFPLTLKARVFDAIQAWVEGRPSEAVSVWERLEAAQVLPAQQMQKGNVQINSRRFDASNPIEAGLIHDLEELETREQRYPVTLSVLNLLDTLIRNTSEDALQLLGQPLRQAGIDPYLDFVLNRVLVKGLNRHYESSNQRFEVFEAAIRTLNALGDSEASVTDSPKLTGVLAKLMIQRERLLDTLAIVVHDCTVDITNSFARAAREGALRLLSLGCSREDILVASLAGISEPSIPLSTAILRRKELVIDVCSALHITETSSSSSSSSSPSSSSSSSSSSVSNDRYHEASRLLLALSLRDAQLLLVVITSAHARDDLRRAVAGHLRSVSTVHTSTKILLKVLVENVRGRWPTIAHALLGFETTSHSNEANLVNTEDGAAVSILHLVQKPNFLATFPELGQLSLRVIYQVLKDPRMSRSMIQYINLRNDSFFSACLSSLPLLRSNIVDEASSDELSHLLLQLAWILKSMAFELHMRRRMKLVEESGPSALDMLGLSTTHDDMRSSVSHHSSSLMIVDILEALHPRLGVDLPPFGGLQRDVCAVIGKETLTSCIDKVHCGNDQNDHLVDEFVWNIERLHSVALSTGQDAQKIVRAASKFNINVKLMSSSRIALNGWIQLVEVWMNAHEPSYTNIELELQLLSAVLSKLADPSWVTSPIGLSQLSLALISHIRARASLISLVSSSRVEQHRIIQRIFAAIMKLQSHAARCHLYAAFYTYMKFAEDIIPKDTSSDHIKSSTQIHGRQWALSSALSELNLSAHYMMRRVCADALDGNLSNRALAMLFLSSFPIHEVLPILEQNNFLIKIIQGLDSCHSSLNAAFTDTPAHYDRVLSYESRILLLLHFSQSLTGARLLFSFDVLGHLLFSFMNARPLSSTTQGIAAPSSQPTALQKYHQALLPSLQLIVALLAVMPHRHDVHEQVIALLLHSESYRQSFLETLREPEHEYVNTAHKHNQDIDTDQLKALLSATTILQLLGRGPLHDHTDLKSVVAIVMTRLPALAFAFRNEHLQRNSSTHHEHRCHLQTLVFQEALALALHLTQRGDYMFDPNMDPKLDRDDVLPSLPANAPIPLGVIVYFALHGALHMLKRAAEQCSRYDECLEHLRTHRSMQRLPFDLITSLRLTPNMSESQQSLVARKQLITASQQMSSQHVIAKSVVQRSLQILFLSLTRHVSTVKRHEVSSSGFHHIDRLKDALDQVESAFSGNEHDDLVTKQIRHCRFEIDALDAIYVATR